jgi:hypothetical protein
MSQLQVIDFYESTGIIPNTYGEYSRPIPAALLKRRVELYLLREEPEKIFLKLEESDRCRIENPHYLAIDDFRNDLSDLCPACHGSGLQSPDDSEICKSCDKCDGLGMVKKKKPSGQISLFGDVDEAVW